jgi:tetratricopeptide (TPR) repeat protein
LCREALEIARRDGSPATRARVIVGFVDAIRNPDTVEERMALTAELLTAAETAGDPALWFWGNLYRAIAATEVPDSAEARRCVDATIRLAEDLRQPTFGWLSRMLASMLAATAGRLDESERLALESSRLGQSTGQADAVVYFAANQFTIGFHRGRLGDVAAALDEALATAPDLVSMQGYAVVAYCETGREAEARRMFDGLLSRLPDLPKEVTWLRLTAQLAVACAHLNDVAGAAILHELMVPYQAQAASTGATWFGAVAHHLGLLAATLGRDAEAEERFAAAEQIHEDFGARPWTARTRLDWAGMLLARSQPGDVDHARKLLGQALATARELGLAAIERRAVELLS